MDPHRPALSPRVQAREREGVARTRPRARVVLAWAAVALVPVVFLGGLAPVFARALAGRWDMRAPLGTALDGALILAREAA